MNKSYIKSNTDVRMYTLILISAAFTPEAVINFKSIFFNS